MGKETTLVALYLCALVSVALSVSGNYKEENEGWSTSAVFTSRNLLDTDDDDDQPPATPQPKKVLSSNTPSVEEIKKLSDSRLRKKLFLLGLPYKNLTVPELRESLTKALYPELAAKQLLEKLEKQKQLEAAEAARQLATKLAEGMINQNFLNSMCCNPVSEARKKKEQEEKEEAQRLAEQRLLDEERQRKQFALEEEHRLKKEAFLAKQAARKEQERYVD